MPLWQRLETWLYENYQEGNVFTVDDVAAGFGVSNGRASQMIQAHLDAQRHPAGKTLYVLKRDGRTASATWSIGQRTADARALGHTLFDDVKVKVMRAFEPDLQAIALRNPRAARYAETKIDAVVAGALRVLAAAVDGDGV